VLESRFYNVKGVRFEARFFRKGDTFPDRADLMVPRQGVWARPRPFGWDRSFFVGESWRYVDMDTDVIHLFERLQGK
jgi:hypothetical protein